MKKIKLVIDTNLIVSSLLGSKNARFLMKEVINGEFELIMGTEQLLEIEDVLKRPKFSKYISFGEVDEFISDLSLIITIPAIYERIFDCRDEKDNMILEEAVYGNAQYIITGDEDLLVLNPYRWIKILNVRDFFNEIFEV